MLRAILKLRPSAGIVVICEDPENESPELAADVVFASARSEPDRVLAGLIEARSLAARRKQA